MEMAWGIRRFRISDCELRILYLDSLISKFEIPNSKCCFRSMPSALCSMLNLDTKKIGNQESQPLPQNLV